MIQKFPLGKLLRMKTISTAGKINIIEVEVVCLEGGLVRGNLVEKDPRAQKTYETSVEM